MAKIQGFFRQFLVKMQENRAGKRTGYGGSGRARG